MGTSQILIGIGIRYIRRFNGKKYYYKLSFTDKRKAKMFADSYKQDNWSVRTIKDKSHYHVYARESGRR